MDIRDMEAMMEIPKPESKPLTPEIVAAELDVTSEAVRDWLTYGVVVTLPKGQRKRLALRGRKIGGRWRITREDLTNFIDATTKHSVSPDAVLPEAEQETAAELRRRGKQGQERVRKMLSGEA